MSVFNELLQLISEASEEDLISLDEKIVSKKKQRKERRLLKQQQKAQQQADSSQTDDKTDDKQTNDEQTDDQATQSNQTTALAIVDVKTLQAIYKDEEVEDYSIEFKQLMNKLSELREKYRQQAATAMKQWQSAGKDVPMPTEVYNNLTKIKEDYFKEIQEFVDVTYPKYEPQLAESEHNAIQQQVEVTQAFLQNFNQSLLSAMPKEIAQKDFEDEIIDAEVVTDDEQSTALTVLDPENDKKAVKKRNKKDKKDKDKRKKQQIVTYKEFAKQYSLLEKTFDTAKKASDAISNMSFGDFNINGGKLIKDNIMAALKSPIVTGFWKALMMTNPLTAMAYEGAFGKLDFSAIKRSNKPKSGIKRDEETKFPSDVKNASVKQMKKEFCTNKDFINTINLLYNTPDVDLKDKAQLKKLTTTMVSFIKDKNVSRDKMVSTYTSLIELVSKILTYLDWNRNTLKTRISKFFSKKGNTNAEEEKINQYVKNNDFNDKKKKLSLKDIDVDDLENSKLFDGMSQEQINAAIKALQAKSQQESMNKVTKQLITLIEMAEA